MKNKPKRTRIASYALIREANSILLCRLSKEIRQWQGYWTLPGGGIEFGESPEEAMIREVEEETGLRVVPKSVATIDTIVNRSGDCEFHGIRILYEVEVLGGSLRSESSGTTDLCQWHPLHPTPDIDLVDLAKVGLLHAQKHPTDPASVVSE